MLFDKLFKKKKNPTTDSIVKYEPIPNKPIIKVEQKPVFTKPVKTELVEKDVIVLWWISKKKKGYDITSKKYPKWFEKKYLIDFDSVVDLYIQQGSLSLEGNIVIITSIGEDELKKFDYVIFVHEHPEFDITVEQIKQSPNFHKVKYEDIAWGLCNQRILDYTRNRMWSSLADNYSTMAIILNSEKKYDKALTFIFATAYIETSGMRDGNELAPIDVDYTSTGKKKLVYLPNGMPDIFLLEISNYGVTVPFLEAQKHLNYDMENIKKMYLNCELINSLENLLPFKYFEKKESFEIFKEAVAEENKKGIFPLKNVSRKLKWNRPDENSQTYFYASVENQMKRKYF